VSSRIDADAGEVKNFIFYALGIIGLIYCLGRWIESRPFPCYPSGSVRIRSDIKWLEVSLALFQAELARLPRSLDELAAVEPPFLEFVPLDPWGAEYVLEFFADCDLYRVGTYGEDGLPGGRGDAQDDFGEWRKRIRSTANDSFPSGFSKE
jgi:hypothetical protein